MGAENFFDESVCILGEADDFPFPVKFDRNFNRQFAQLFIDVEASSDDADEIREVLGHFVAERFHFLSVVRVFFLDRKSTRLNSSHVKISYAVFCLKKKS